MKIVQNLIAILNNRQEDRQNAGFFLQIQENGAGFFPLKDRKGNCDKLPLVDQKGTAFSFMGKRFYHVFSTYL